MPHDVLWCYFYLSLDQVTIFGRRLGLSERPSLSVSVSPGSHVEARLTNGWNRRRLFRFGLQYQRQATRDFTSASHLRWETIDWGPWTSTGALNHADGRILTDDGNSAAQYTLLLSQINPCFRFRQETKTLTIRSAGSR